MASIRSIQALLSAGEMSGSKREAQRSFAAALAEADEAIATGGGPDVFRLRSQIRAVMIREEVPSSIRAQQWLDVIRQLRAHSQISWDAGLIDALAQCVSDAAQDISESDMGEPFLEALNASLTLLTSHIESATHNRKTSAILLARKASVLRHRAELQMTINLARSDGQLAYKLSKESVAQYRCEETLVEFGLSAWACTRYASDSTQFKALLAESEQALLDGAVENNLIPLLALSRLYRLTYRPKAACNTFAKALLHFDRKRQVLRAAHIYAESAAGLPECEDEGAPDHLIGANELLEHAESAGLLAPRGRLALAHVKALIGGISEARPIFDELGSWRGATAFEALSNWSVIFEKHQHLEAAHTLGIANSGLFNRIAAILRQVRIDQTHVEALYRTAVALDPRDPIALTNLARCLVEQGGDERLAEADRLLQKAASHADLRFQWWRNVRGLLRKKRMSESGDRCPRPAKVASKGAVQVRTFSQLSRQFEETASIQSHQERGYKLETMMAALANMSPEMAWRGSYRTGTRALASQVDGFLEYDGASYRVECKWRNKPCDPVSVALLHDRLDVAQLSGLFISMSGFTDQAIEKALTFKDKHIILLMNGDEVRLTMHGQIPFGDLIARKRVELNQRSKMYFARIQPTV